MGSRLLGKLVEGAGIVGAETPWADFSPLERTVHFLVLGFSLGYFHQKLDSRLHGW